LLLLHITIVVAAISLTPDGYYFQLGGYTGSALVLSSVILWWLLLSAKTGRAITTFCVLALGQATFMALVALHFRAEDRALRPIIEALAMERNRWESQMGSFAWTPFFEMISGKRVERRGTSRDASRHKRKSKDQ
jgi:hypothetical protein